MGDEPAKTCRVVGKAGGFGAGRTELAGYPWAAFRRPWDQAARPLLSGDTFGETLDV